MLYSFKFDDYSLKKYFYKMLLKNIKIKNIVKFYRLDKIFITTLVAAFAIIIILSSLVFLTGCEKINGLKNDILDRFNSEKQSEAAVAVVSQFFNFLIAQDYDSAYALIYVLTEPTEPTETPETSETSEMPESPKTLEDFKKEFLSVTKIVSFEINWVEVKNNIAIVGIDMIDTYDGEEKIYKDIQVSLVKDKDESWKINFWNQ